MIRTVLVVCVVLSCRAVVCAARGGAGRRHAVRSGTQLAVWRIRFPASSS